MNPGQEEISGWEISALFETATYQVFYWEVLLATSLPSGVFLGFLSDCENNVSGLLMCENVR